MTRRLAFAASLLVLAASGFASGSALAQDREADAERLFREGQELLEERRYGEACPKFEAAYKKDGQLGTLLNLAFCHKEQGATWYAWLEFREAEVKATEQSRTDRRDFAKGQLPALEKSLAKLVIDNPKNVPLVEVLVEDRKVPEAEKGAPFAAEPGQRKLTFRAKGKKTGTLLVHVAKSDKPMHVATPDLEDMPPEAPPESAPATDGTISRASMPAARAETPGSQSSQKTLALGVLGVGVVSGVVMGITGVMTLSNECASGGDRTKCRDDDEGRAEIERGKTTATIATVTGVIAGVALAGGAVLWLTAPKSTAEAKGKPRIAPGIGLGWAGVAGAF
jgi:hypothetical protein